MFPSLPKTEMAMDASKPRFPDEKYEIFFDQADREGFENGRTLRTLTSRKFWFIATFALLAGLFLTIFRNCARLSSRDLPQRPMKATPHSLMIELDTSGDGAARTMIRESFLAEIDHRQIQYTIGRNISSPIFNGLSVIVETDEDDHTIMSLTSLSYVQRVWRPIYIPRPKTKPVLVGGTEMASGFTKRGLPIFPPHVQTGVDELHEEGIFGTGIKVGIIDSGIDYKHPALGGCFGPGCKVAFGTVLVGDAFNESNIPIPDPDPMDCNGHGTHVAGIIAANALTVNAPTPFIGVAPNVTLGIWRVFGCEGGTTDEILIDAIVQAHAAGMDIISMSIGGANGWSESPLADVASRTADEGIYMSISAGNDGEEGLFLASDLSSGPHVGAVASVDSPSYFAFLAQAGPEGKNIEYFSQTPFPGVGKLSIHVPTDDGCAPFPSNAPSLENSLILITLRGCLLGTKIENIKAANGRFVWFDPGDDFPSFPSSIAINETVHPAYITKEEAAFLRSLLPNSAFVTFKSPVKGEFIENKPTGGALSIFTSWGLTNEMAFYPHIAAPGGEILSTYPLANGGYAVDDGTSMACPHISGVVALYLSVKGKSNPVSLRNFLVSTANPIDFNNGSNFTKGLKTSCAQQGGGLVDAHHLIKGTTEVEPGFISLNDSARFNGTHKIRLFNKGSCATTYTLEGSDAATAYVLSNSTAVAVFPPVVDHTKAVSITFTPATLKIEPGHSATFTAQFSLKSDFDKSLVPVYSGFIEIHSSAEEKKYQVPFAGVAYNVTSLPIFDTTNGLPIFARLSDASPSITHVISDDGIVFTMNVTTGDLPTIDISFFMGTRVLRLDLLPSNPGITAGTTLVAGLNILDSVDGFPFAKGIARSTRQGPFETFSFNGNLSSGTIVPNGKYRLAARALKMLAENADNADSWDTFISPAFEIMR